jgi:hypothetical protein
MPLGISEAVELAGTVSKLVKAGITLELQEKVVDLREAVLNAKDEVVSLREENGELKRRLRDRAQLVYDATGEHYRPLNSEGDFMYGAFCSRCFDTKELRVNLRVVNDSFGKWRCPESGTHCGPKSTTSPVDPYRTYRG